MPNTALDERWTTLRTPAAAQARSNGRRAVHVDRSLQFRIAPERDLGDAVVHDVHTGDRLGHGGRVANVGDDHDLDAVGLRPGRVDVEDADVAARLLDKVLDSKLPK